MAERTCAICPAPVVGQSKTCSPECGRLRRNKKQLEFYARYREQNGVAYTSRYREERNARSREGNAASRKYVTASQPCVYCDKQIRHRADHAAFKYCSRACAVRARSSPASKISVVDCEGGCGNLRTLRFSLSWRCEACPLPAAVEVATNPRFQAGRCRRCDEYFVMLWNNVPCLYCSGRCQKRDSDSNRRTRKRGAFVAPVFRARIFERDGWRCQICKKKVRRNAVVPHPLAPVLDHITPLADGGTHEPANVQCAHYMCNSVKSAGAANDQLRLIG